MVLLGSIQIFDCQTMQDHYLILMVFVTPKDVKSNMTSLNNEKLKLFWFVLGVATKFSRPNIPVKTALLLATSPFRKFEWRNPTFPLEEISIFLLKIHHFRNFKQMWPSLSWSPPCRNQHRNQLPRHPRHVKVSQSCSSPKSEHSSNCCISNAKPSCAMTVVLPSPFFLGWGDLENSWKLGQHLMFFFVVWICFLGQNLMFFVVWICLLGQKSDVFGVWICLMLDDLGCFLIFLNDGGLFWMMLNDFRWSYDGA